MAVNFDAPVRLTEALLPLLRVRAELHRQRLEHRGRIGRPHSGAYSASKFALAGWSDALQARRSATASTSPECFPLHRHGGIPQREIVGSLKTRWLVAKPDTVADAILDAGPGGKPERYTPRPYWLVPAARVVAPASSGGRRRGRDVALHDGSLTRAALLAPRR
jgi:short-subunit dehydrogenase